MGKTKYPDTNNQFAYKTDRDGFLARIKYKAETLWLDGYRAILDPDHEFSVFLVWNDTQGMPAGYKVNAAEGTCTCPFCTDQEQFPLDPDNPGLRIHCKHVKGLKGLISEEISYFKA